MPTCFYCKVEKDDTEFYLTKTKTGFTAYKRCKGCNNKDYVKKTTGSAKLSKGTQEGVRMMLIDRRNKIKAIAQRYEIHPATLQYWIRHGQITPDTEKPVDSNANQGIVVEKDDVKVNDNKPNEEPPLLDVTN